MFELCKNPLTGLSVGLLATVLFQSSTTTTSIIGSLVGAGSVNFGIAVSLIMGCNIGTTTTNALVSLCYIKNRTELSRAFSSATNHCIFNCLTVLCLFPIEWFIMPYNNQCGFVCTVADRFTDLIVSSKGISFTSPLDYLTKPITDTLIEVNSKAYKAFSYGCSKTSTSTCPSKNKTESLYYCIGDNGVDCLSPNEWHNKYDSMSVVKSCWLKDSWKFNDLSTGIMLVIISTILLILSLILLVFVLKKLVRGKIHSRCKRIFNINGYVCIIIGCVLTFLVHSSSVITSILTPLAAVDVLDIEHTYAYTLGANLGTTITPLLSIIESNNKDQIKIALCHVWFNVLGIVIWYIFPVMRNVPLSYSNFMRNTVEQKRYIALLFWICVYVVIPLTVLGISVMLSGGTGLMWTALSIMMVVVVGFIGGFYWYKFKNGKLIITKVWNKKRSLKFNDEKIVEKRHSYQKIIVDMKPKSPESIDSNES